MLDHHQQTNGEFLDPIVFCMSSHFEYGKHTHLTVEGRGSGFSVEAPEAVSSTIRSRLFTDAEMLTMDDR